jgi:predicted deacylase
MRENLRNLAEKYPDFMSLQTAEDLYGIRHRVNCDNQTRCQVDLVTLSNKKSSKPKTQVFFSGALHGDEVIGPNSAYYFIEYLLSNRDE